MAVWTRPARRQLPPRAVTAARRRRRAGAAAVMGVSFFGAAAPENFATFDAAFMTLFYVTGGDPWPDTLPKHNDDGTTNWQVAGHADAGAFRRPAVRTSAPAIHTRRRPRRPPALSAPCVAQLPTRSARTSAGRFAGRPALGGGRRLSGVCAS